MAGPGGPGDPGDLIAPTLIARIRRLGRCRERRDHGRSPSCSTTRRSIATFDADVLFDYRARRPTLDIVDGRLALLTWPELAIRRVTVEANATC